MIDAVRRYECYVVQSTGDGIFALFGVPDAHVYTDDAKAMRRAVTRTQEKELALDVVRQPQGITMQI